MPAEDEHAGRQELDLRIPAQATMVARVRQALADFGMPHSLLGDAQLLVTELVGNSIRHAGLGPEEEIRVTAEWSNSTLRVEVRDRGAGAALPALSGSIFPNPGAESGWGLFLVDRLASRWGATPGRYWFELGEPSDDV